jgi:putative iron-dependent peroxidase
MKNKTREDQLEGFRQACGDIQAIVGTGFPGLRRARYLLIRIHEPEVARGWLRQLLDAGLVHGIGHLRRHGQGGEPMADAAARSEAHALKQSAYVALSHAGLQTLGLQDDPLLPFPSAFRSGMASPLRRQLFGESGEAPLDWGDVEGTGCPFVVHMFVAHYWHVDAGLPAPLLDPAQMPPGLDAQAVSTCPSYIEEPVQPGGDPAIFEPFGSRDGIGQPVLAGLKLSRSERASRLAAGKLFEDRIVMPGEFVLGQKNEYGESAYCPNVLGWPAARPSAATGFGRNGSYLAVRQIVQHVASFRGFAAAHPGLGLAERFIGRRKNQWNVDSPDDGYSLLDGAEPPAEIDAFRYLEADADGFGCPRGAHARRANPRDTLAVGVQRGISDSKLHRMLRRGRVFATGCATAACSEDCRGHRDARSGEPPCGQGMMFVALNADLERQFEFVQQNWIAGSRFGDLSDERDPILGVGARSFTVQGCPVGQRIEPLPRFTTVTGSGYFFLPSLSALDWLSGRSRP